MTTSEKLTWAAGVFSAAGCISIVNRPGPSVRLYFSSNDLSLLEQFQQAVGFGNITPRSSAPGGTQMYMWHSARSQEVYDFLTLIAPWLVGRRLARAQAGIEALYESQHSHDD